MRGAPGKHAFGTHLTSRPLTHMLGRCRGVKGEGKGMRMCLDTRTNDHLFFFFPNEKHL